MGIEIAQETEARLAAEAQRHGFSVNTLLKRFINEHAGLTLFANGRLATVTPKRSLEMTSINRQNTSLVFCLAPSAL
jgi:hypothetical protein